MLLGVVGCKPADETIGIGVAAPLTGEVASYGEKVKRASVLAEEEMNAAGGINGKKLRLILEDSRCDPATGVSVMKKLVDIDKVPVVLGETCSSVTLAMAPIAEKNKVVLLTPISSNYKITDAGDYVFRLAPSDALQGRLVAKWIKELGYTKAAVIFVNNDYGVGLKDGFTKNFEELGGKVVLAEGFQQGARDFRAQLAKIKNAKVEVIFAPAYPEEAGQLLKQRKELNVAIPLIGTDPYHDPKIFDLAGDAANGVMFADVAGGSGPGWDAFVKAYKAKYGIEPDIVAAEAYDSVKVVAQVMSQAGFEPNKIKEGLYTLKGYMGATGAIEFDKNGDNIMKSFQKFRIEHKKYQEIKE
jgi:branched-chain amino acid transport system substrate-binding protein